MIYEVIQDELSMCYDPEEPMLKVDFAGKCWQWTPDGCWIELTNGRKLMFGQAQCKAEFVETGISKGVRAVYSDFTDGEKAYPYTVGTWVALDSVCGRLRMEIWLEGDRQGEIRQIFWPCGFDFAPAKGEGYTVFPIMQGCIYPAKWIGPYKTLAGGAIYSFDAYMPLLGQVWGGTGYSCIIDTPCDAAYDVVRSEEGDTTFRMRWLTSLGHMAYRRVLIMKFHEACDYNVIAKDYRCYLKEHGRLVTLRQKIDRNPRVKELLGAPILNTGIYTHISPQSIYYKADDPAHNDHFVSFSRRAEELRTLKDMGLERAYLHLDGWGRRGYDNLHPDVFPPAPCAGGADGMRELAETCKGLGYIFGIHDQYRDYYFDADTFSLDNACQAINGSHPSWAIWAGGEQTPLCATLAPDYVKRNFETFKKMDIDVQGAYLDVFSVVELEECFNPAHIMSREMCARKRLECFDYLNAHDIIPSSEEAVDAMLPALALCHYAPHATSEFMGDPPEEAKAFGVPIPLTSLVYHDCIVVPWYLDKQDGRWWSIGQDWAYLYVYITGGTIGIRYDDVSSVTPQTLELTREAMIFQEKTQLYEMVRHEFLDDDYRRQRSFFADGTITEVDLDKKEWHVTFGKSVTDSQREQTT